MTNIYPGSVDAKSVKYHRDMDTESVTYPGKMETNNIHKRRSSGRNSESDGTENVKKEKKEINEKGRLPEASGPLILAPRGLVLLVTCSLISGAFIGTLTIFNLRPSTSGRDYHHGNVASSNSIGSDGHAIFASTDGGRKQPVAWMLSDNEARTALTLGIVIGILKTVGYRIETSEDYKGDFDVLYTHYNLYYKEHIWNRIEKHHMVNHFPGIGLLGEKKSFALNCQKFDFIPKAFKIPSDKDKFLAYAEQHPNKRWLQKKNNHRYIYMKDAKDIDLEDGSNFIQEFLEDLLLIDGRRFDIGIFTTITSIEPLRVYIFEDWVVRFCADEFDATNTTNRLSYVINNEHRSYWNVPLFNNTLKYRTRRQGTCHHLKSRGFDVELLQDKFTSAIEQVIRHSMGYIQRLSRNRTMAGQNFELMRFDFMIGKQMEVYLLEANMSPNLYQPPYMPAVKVDSYTKTVHDMLSLVGVVNSWGGPVTQWPDEMRQLLVTDIDLQVDLERCAVTCQGDNCTEERCRWCVDCISPEDVAMLKRTYLEHTNRGRWRRIVPTPFKAQASALQWNPESDVIFQEMDAGERLLTTWFRGKCLQNQDWCT